MEGLLAEHERLSKSGTFTKSLDDIQKTIDLLVKARETIAASEMPFLSSIFQRENKSMLIVTLVSDTETASLNLAKLQTPVKNSLEDVHKDLEEVRKCQSKYLKLLDKKFKDKTLPQMDYVALSAQPALINRAVAMHLLREGQFSVASTFLSEATKDQVAENVEEDLTMSGTEQDLGLDSLKSESLRKQFANMYHILHEMKNERNLLPAIEWARDKSEELEKRGSNLEFELGKLQFVWLFVGRPNQNGQSNLYEGRQHALEYIRQELSHFRPRYHRELQQLCGAIAFCPNLPQSPYRRTFLNNEAWDELATSFTKEFCALLGLSADSPLYIAATAGAIALPHFSKLQVIMKDKRTEWTTKHEIPVEVPLPPSYRFHSIFVCPVSKEQTTDQNPPMMMPCGHVVAKESLMRLSKNARFKCPYCPNESHPKDAMKIYM
ncbi:MAG: hypothetical protein LQ341_002077 [Variospora aurantia]|nr:MAG: hypothetical protein LQ341_002077 [Variospora aurantia]